MHTLQFHMVLGGNMRGQLQNDAAGMTHPVENLTGPFLENNTYSEEDTFQECGIVTAYPGGSIELSVFNAINGGSKSTISIWDTTQEGGFTLRYANPLMLRIMDKTARDAFGKDFDDVFESDARQCIYERYSECARHQREVEFVHNFFGSRMLVTRLCPQMEHGRTVRVISTSSDITDYLRTQSRLQAENDRLRQQVALLDVRLIFESLVSGALRDFMSAGGSGFDGCLDSVNRELGMLLDADQACILQYYSENLCVHKARWVREACAPYVGIGHVQSASLGLAQLTRLLVINDTRREGHLPFARDLLALGVRAFLAVPIRRDEQAYGLLCLAQTSGPRAWTTAEISLMRTAADTIMGACLRNRLENGLNENVRVLTEYDEALQDLLSQKEALAEISCGFLHAGPQGFGTYAGKALRDVCRLLCLDGARALFRTADGIKAYDWQESGLPRHILSRNGTLHEAALRAARQAPIAIDDTAEDRSELAKAAAAEGLRSLLIVPISNPEGEWGVLLGCKAIGVRLWTPGEIVAMDAFARIFSDAWRLMRSCGRAADPA